MGGCDREFWLTEAVKDLHKKAEEVKKLEEDKEKLIALCIRNDICPFIQGLKPSSLLCPRGFPGCGCEDEVLLNPHLQDMRDKCLPPEDAQGG